jgi:hypothetical protein
VTWFSKPKPTPSTVELFELYADGAAFSWNDDFARATALEMFVEVVRRLEGEREIERLRLGSGMPEPLDPADPIDVADLGEFLRSAPQLVRPYYKSYRLEFRLNEGNRPYGIRHLDQSTSGFWFYAPVSGEQFLTTLQEVLTDFERRPTSARVSTGQWFRER